MLLFGGRRQLCKPHLPIMSWDTPHPFYRHSRLRTTPASTSPLYLLAFTLLQGLDLSLCHKEGWDFMTHEWNGEKSSSGYMVRTKKTKYWVYVGLQSCQDQFHNHRTNILEVSWQPAVSSLAGLRNSLSFCNPHCGHCDWFRSVLGYSLP